MSPTNGSDDRPRATTGITFQPGDVLSYTYAIEVFVARGGMGEVYRARHVKLGTDHAIKVIQAELLGNERVVDLFQREASVLRTVRHDSIVGYEGVILDETGRMYLVMEFVEGPSLSAVLRRRGGLGVDDVRRLRDRLATGLAEAHDRGIVHRDLSPDNVILQDGLLERAKIIDFGIAKIDDPEVSTIVGSAFAGKYSYASPEQLGLFGGVVGVQSDIYSLGLILAAAATGKALNMGTSMSTVVEARQSVPNLDRVPAELRDEIAVLLQPDPADRPVSMDAVLDMGQRPSMPGGRSLAPSSSRPDGSPPLSRPPRRTGSRPPPSDGSVAPVDRPRRGGGPWPAVLFLLFGIAAAGGGGYWYYQRHLDGRDLTAIRSDIAAVVAGIACGEITATVDDGRAVTLTGSIGSETERTDLVRRVSAIEAVADVRDDLTIVACETPPRVDPWAIEQAVRAEMATFGCIEVMPQVAGDGTVTLDGTIGSVEDRTALAQAVARIDGVSAVADRIAVRACLDLETELAEVVAALDTLDPAVSCGPLAADLDDAGQIVIGGSVPDPTSIDTIEELMAVTTRAPVRLDVRQLGQCPQDPEAARAAIAEAVTRFTDSIACGEVTATIGPDNSVVLTGTISGGATIDKLTELLASISGLGAVRPSLEVIECVEPTDGDNGEPPPDPAAVQEQVSALIAAPVCARLDATIGDDAGVALAGFVASEADRSELRAALEALTGAAPNDDAVAVRPWPLCQALLLVDDLDGTGALSIVPNHADATYADNEVVSITVTAPADFDGFLYLDYIDRAGNVVHLSPSLDRPDNALVAGDTITVGADPEEDPDGRVYRAGAPFGENLVIAIASDRALFDTLRREAEAAGSYLDALEDAIQRVQAEGGTLAAGAAVLTFTP